MTRALPLLVLAAAALTGCSNDYWVDFRFVTDAPPSTVVNSDRIEIEAGRAVGVEAWPVEDNQRLGVTLDMLPVRVDLIGIDRGLEDRQWVIFGKKAGSTEIEIHVDGEYVGDMSAVVLEP